MSTPVGPQGAHARLQHEPPHVGIPAVLDDDAAVRGRARAEGAVRGARTGRPRGRRAADAERLRAGLRADLRAAVGPRRARVTDLGAVPGLLALTRDAVARAARGLRPAVRLVAAAGVSDRAARGVERRAGTAHAIQAAAAPVSAAPEAVRDARRDAAHVVTAVVAAAVAVRVARGAEREAPAVAVEDARVSQADGAVAAAARAVGGVAVAVSVGAGMAVGARSRLRRGVRSSVRAGSVAGVAPARDEPHPDGADDGGRNGEHDRSLHDDDAGARVGPTTSGSSMRHAGCGDLADARKKGDASP